MYWQLIGRTGSGSIFNSHSGTYGLFLLWAGLDRWLLFGGIVLLPVAFAIRQLRPSALALGLQVLFLLRGGYIPYMYVTAMLPFGSLVISGTMDTLWQPLDYGRNGRRTWRNLQIRVTMGQLQIRVTMGRPTGGQGAGLPRFVSLWVGRLAVLAFSVIFAVSAGPTWLHALTAQAKVNGASAELAATTWIEHSLPKGAVVVVDDYIWTDIKMHGSVNPLSIWKVDGDPWVTKHVLPYGYKSIDYIVLIPQTASTLATLPTLATAWKHSVVIKNFGDGLTARMIVKTERPHLP